MQDQIVDMDKNEIISHWCEELNLGTAELEEIIDDVGTSVEAVRDFLARRCMQREATF